MCIGGASNAFPPQRIRRHLNERQDVLQPPRTHLDRLLENGRQTAALRAAKGPTTAPACIRRSGTTASHAVRSDLTATGTVASGAASSTASVHPAVSSNTPSSTAGPGIAPELQAEPTKRRGLLSPRSDGGAAYVLSTRCDAGKAVAVAASQCGADVRVLDAD